MRKKRSKERLTQEELDIQWLCRKYSHLSKDDLESCYREELARYQHIQPIAHFASILALLAVLTRFGS